MPKDFHTLNPEILFNHMQDAVYVIDPESSNILWCNRPAYEELGYEKEEILNHSVLSLQKHVVGLPHWQEVAAVIRENKSFTFIGNHQHKNGGDISVEIVTTVFEHLEAEYFLSIARNIGKRIQHDQALHSRNHRISFALNEASDGLWEWEIDTGKVFFSPQLKKMLGYGPDEMPPTIETWSDNIHPDDLVSVMKHINRHLADEYSHYEDEYRLKNRNGEYLWVHDKGKICERDASGKPSMMVGMVRNINKTKLLEQQLESLASEDFLTKLPNRRCGEHKAKDLINKAIELKQPLCVAMLDLDDFKTINDQYGHAKGDEVLAFCASILKDFQRESDLIYRWGGEEFVCVLPNTSLQVIEKVSAQMHQHFKDANWQEIGIPRQTVSIGLACTTESFLEDFETLFKQADSAVYAAKNNGRNQSIIADKTNCQYCP
ncbi:MAG: diguanylate cyclase [Thiotrichales bacterium]|nr:diguanylate cyclase [Thiotrichales bacterium]